MNKSSLSLTKLFPNPARENIYFKGLDNDTEVSVYDLFGRLILKNKTNKNSLNISELNSGIYCFEFYIQGDKIVQKIIIE